MSKPRMRYCFSEAPEVYEVSGNDLAELLKTTARSINDIRDDNPDAWFALNVGMGVDGDDYNVTLYSH